MSIKQITVQEVQKHLLDEPELESNLLELINASIGAKKTAFLKKDHENLLRNETLSIHITEIPEDRFQLKYDSLVVDEVLLRKAENMNAASLPNEPLAALEFTDKFCEEIRKPKIRTYWYGQLESGLESYVLVYLNHVYKIDVTSFLRGLTDVMKDEKAVLRNYESNYEGAFPYLTDTVEQSFDTLVYLYSTEGLEYHGAGALEKIGNKNKEKAWALYEYSKVKGAIKYNRFLPTLLLPLYSSDKKKCYDEAVELHKQDQVQGLVTMAFFQYEKGDEIEQVFQFITSSSVSEIEYQIVLVDFHCRLIENSATPATTRSKCFSHLKELFKVDDDHLRHHMIGRVGLISGYDEEKFELLPEFLQAGQKNVIHNFFNHFKSPKYLFSLIRDAYLHHGMKVSYDAFSQAVSMQFHQNPDASESELLAMLTDDLAIVRYAGLQILTGNHGQAYNVRLLNLDEEGQKRVIETFLIQPVGIEELLPIVLHLRKSSFNTVQDLLSQQLIELIWAYDHSLVDLVKPILDLSDDNDKQLFEKLDEGYKVYLKEKDIRNSINEFNPYQNELQSLELYYRLEQEKNAEIMERASGKSFFTQMAKNISVIRGSAFKAEENPAITKMTTISSSRLVDQRYYRDPEYYEWIFQLNVYGKNYSKPE